MPRQLVVAVDLSGSRTDAEVAADRDLLETIVKSLRPGDDIVLIRIAGEDGQRGLAIWSRSLPAFTDPNHPTKDQQRWFRAGLEDARRDIKNLFAQRGSIRGGGTDIRAALFAVSDRAKEAAGKRTTLVLLSDMIQEAGDLNFTKAKGIPRHEWFEAQQEASLIPALPKVCVSVVGPDISIRMGVEVRTFWSAYFDAAGAIFSNSRYRRTMTQFESLLCEE